MDLGGITDKTSRKSCSFVRDVRLGLALEEPGHYFSGCFRIFLKNDGYKTDEDTFFIELPDR